MERQFTEQEQLDIIKEVEEKYSKFLDPNFDASIFLECRDNFALTSHIESVKIFEMNNPPSNPTFTIAIPTYNRCETLKEAIDSALAQETDEHYEVIVIENVDNFDEKTEAQEMLEREYRGKLTYYKNKENLGLFGNWNRCLTLAKGQWVCILHSDDMITQDYIKEMKLVVNNKKYSDATLIGVGGDTLCFPDESTYSKLDKIVNFFKNKTMDDLSYQGIQKTISPCASLHNKEKCIYYGGYNSDEYPHGDTFFHRRIFLYDKIYHYTKKLQTKGIGINTYYQPSTLLKYFFIGSSFILGHYKPKAYAKHMATSYLEYYKDLLKDYPILQQYAENILADKKRFSKLPKNLWRLLYLYEHLVIGRKKKKHAK